MSVGNDKFLVVRYKGGLGNQMFQYALKVYLKQYGRKVYDDVSFYESYEMMPFKLTEAFVNVDFQRVSSDIVKEIFENYQSRNIFLKVWNKIFISTKKYYYEKKELRYDKNVCRVAQGCVDGYWQTYRYAEEVEIFIRKSFVFKEIDDEQLISLKKKINESNSVSVHIRAGDYLSEENKKIYGGICTQEYYMKAIELIQKSVDNAKFFVFSNDIEFCKNNFRLNDAVWIEHDKISPCEDWKDLYLMSCCKHNIIANSSFSWWGAWLNKNVNKIVIAPKRWLNQIDNDEVCPKTWKRI